MKDMINDMINDMRNNMKNDMICMKLSGVVLKDNENGKILGPYALCVLMHWGIPLFLDDGMGAYTIGQENDHYV